MVNNRKMITSIRTLQVMVSCGALGMAHWESLKWYEKYLGCYFLRQKKTTYTCIPSYEKICTYTSKKKKKDLKEV